VNSDNLGDGRCFTLGSRECHRSGQAASYPLVSVPQWFGPIGVSMVHPITWQVIFCNCLPFLQTVSEDDFPDGSVCEPG